MKKVSVLVLLLTIGSLNAFAQYEDDVKSIDSITEALYASISGEKGVERDWDRFKNLFIPEAYLMPTGVTQEGEVVYRRWGIDEYIERVDKSFLENGFLEVEISKEVDQFRNIAHVFTTYESRRTKDGDIIARGINSVQLFYDDNRWWIVSVFWSPESPDHQIPAEYLGDS